MITFAEIIVISSTVLGGISAVASLIYFKKSFASEDKEVDSCLKPELLILKKTRTHNRLMSDMQIMARKQKAVELSHMNAQYHERLGTELYIGGRHKAAETELRQAMELEPENALYHYSLGITLRAMGRYKEAEAEMRKAVKLEPQNKGYHQGLNYTHALKHVARTTPKNLNSDLKDNKS